MHLRKSPTLPRQREGWAAGACGGARAARRDPLAALGMTMRCGASGTYMPVSSAEGP